MKGTLFSADFVIDESSNLRLLELNTDTAFVSVGLYNHFDFTDFFNLLSSNGITEMAVIHKHFQNNFVDHLEQAVASDATFITKFVKVKEFANTVYPTVITDESNRFILRLAYDENAVFDSTYCKDRVNVLKLFNENSGGTSVPEAYFSSSDGVINTLTSSINNNERYPDIVSKHKTQSPQPLVFKKFGDGVLAESSSADLYSDYLNNYLDKENLYIEKFHTSPTTISDGVAKSIRTFQIVYGSNLDTLQLGAYKIDSMFGLPSDISQDTTEMLYDIPAKHYFEYTTNFMKDNYFEGLLDSEAYKEVNDTYTNIVDARVSGSVKSYHVSGSPDTDNREMYASWSFTGNTLTDSFPTESVIYAVESQSFEYPGLIEINLGDGSDSIYCGTQKSFLTYNTSSNVWSYKEAHQLTSSVDFLTNESGSAVPISSSNYAILENHTDKQLVRIDVEDTDTYFVSSSESVVTHNFHFGWRHPGGGTCFAAGTKISLENGDTKNIEDIVIGDEVLGWDGEDIGVGVVTAIDHRHTVASHAEACERLGDKPSLYTINNTGIEFTPEHPFLTKEGWKSLVPEIRQEPYKSEAPARELEVGDFINVNGDWEEIKEIKVVRSNEEEPVYNFTVDKLHSYIANGIIVHNK